MYVAESGPEDGRPMLMLHGGGVGGWMWAPAATGLTDRFRLIVPDLPGHDHSADENYRSHDDTVRGLVELIMRRSPNTAPIVVGFSLGAQLTVRLAGEHPELVAAAVVVSALAVPSRVAAMTTGLVRLAAPLARNAWFARQQARALYVPPELENDYLRTSTRLTTETLAATVSENMRFTPPSGWGRFAGPTLILVGGRERAVMKRSAEILERHAAHAESEIVDGCGHGIPLQRPQWFAERIGGGFS